MISGARALLVGAAVMTVTFLPATAVSAQPPAGLGARALADTAFKWVADSMPGIRVYFLRNTDAWRMRDSLKARLPMALGHARALIDAPPLAGPVDVFFIQDRTQMRALVGASATGFAHMQARAVFVVTNSEWRAFDRHEIMHVVAAGAWGHIGPRNAWLQEGLAQAADGQCAGFTNAQVAVSLARRHGWIALDTLIGRFREQSDLRAYLQAAAFVQYLLATVGPSAVRELWAGEPTPATQLRGVTLAEWESAWRRSVELLPSVPADALKPIEAVGCGVKPPPS
jgi:hypothetical protein